MKQQRMVVHKDLQYERNRCTFDPVEVTYFLDGSPEKTKQRRDREQYFSDVLALKENMSMRYKSHKEIYEDSLRITREVFSKIKKLQLSKTEEYEFVLSIFAARLGSALFPDGNPVVVHYAMFLPALMGQANSEQQTYWINRAWAGDVIGTYAQTELGHGTFLRGLETTATYDPETKEFVLNSPTLASYKWWPGGLGHTANHAIVVAQLYTQGECRGIHPFVVQLRDVETHEPLKDIIIGEIGTKLGMNSANNGFLGFRNFRIPRENMLMKNSKVLEDGTYVKSTNDKLTYGTMVFVRVMLLHDLLHYLSKAVTIAVRYSVVRRQGQINPEQPEVQILDYVTQQNKIFPHIATCFAIKVTASWVLDMYHAVQSQVHQANYEKLPELHSLSCCLKAVVSADTAAGIEQLRLSCGGHGYMTASNLPTLYGLATAVCTYEGENTVLLLQTARYLVKSWKQAMDGEPLPESVEYLNEAAKGGKHRRWSNDLECLIDAYSAVAAGSVRLAAEHLYRRIRDGVPIEEAWNQTGIELAQCAEAHARAFIVKTFAKAIKQLNSKSKEFRQVMFQLCELYIVYWALRNVGNFLRFSSMQKEHVQPLHSRLEYLLTTIRRNAVGIVDGFDFDDHILCSALGAYDGNVYERLFQEAMKSPLNHETVNMFFKKYLKAFVKSNL
ncbi:probable peroxisomal acyl-coenzyme A oxidase 1 isoform X1 [Bombus pyrosoma]|uniref:probable peroxisomal acyl-coenzyme A oxidase 1 isoform X1 n=2 Tax=Bombus pyrosoma TaxID=396416 RepID=UPI001CB99ADC|nr:probable peroxisomal acyl-coenzyme A oxidase 1 isoform X1 [Bombus pyrosoma]